MKYFAWDDEKNAKLTAPYEGRVAENVQTPPARRHYDGFMTDE